VNDFDIEIIPVLQSNYIYILHDTSSNNSVVIDPSIDKPVLDVINQKNRKISAIFCTHRHWDHIGGVMSIKKKTSCAVYGGTIDIDSIPGIDKTLDDGDEISLLGHKAEILFLPGHTSGITACYFKDLKKLFIADLIFPMGCGMVFDGKIEDLFNSIERVKKLPKDTLLYTGHEYAHGNARFALSVEPNNQKLLDRFYKVAELTKNGEPTNPTLLSDELETNPFMRTDSLEIRKNLNMEDASNLEVFTKLRQMKDDF